MNLIKKVSSFGYDGKAITKATGENKLLMAEIPTDG